MRRKWITIEIYIDLETGERIAGRYKARQQYNIVRKHINRYYDEKKHAGVTEITIECRKQERRQGDLFE